MTYTKTVPVAVPAQIPKTTSAPSPEVPSNNKFMLRDLKFKPIALS